MNWHQTLEELRATLGAHEGYPCITLTMPTARSMPDNAQDPVRLKKLVAAARKRLEEEAGKRPAAKALESLERAAESVDHNRNYEGLAIFASEEVELTLKTRFPLPESLTIDERFAIRTLLRAERRAEPYAVLALSLEEARLFEGQREDLFEVRGQGFPAKNSSVGAGSKVPSGPGVNATKAVDESRRRFVRECLDMARAVEGLPATLVACGTEEILSSVQGEVGASFDVVATLAGNYLRANPSELGAKAWAALREARRARSAELVERLQEARSQNRYESGIQPLAALAAQGNIAMLVCGMDYRAAGVVNEATGDLTFIEEPTHKDDVDDVVEWVVQKVLDTGGEVRFVEEDLMGEAPIAAVTRY
jgi:hypothetical protein